MKWNGKTWIDESAGEIEQSIEIGFMKSEYVLNCLRCGNKFLPKMSKIPSKCPNCTSKFWNMPIKNKKISEKAHAVWEKRKS